MRAGRKAGQVWTRKGTSKAKLDGARSCAQLVVIALFHLAARKCQRKLAVGLLRSQRHRLHQVHRAFDARAMPMVKDVQGAARLAKCG